MPQAMTSVHNDLVAIVHEYLGPAGERFIDRQIEFHLKKKPDEVSLPDISKLVEWIKVSLAVLTDDQKLVDECVEKIQRLTA